MARQKAIARSPEEAERDRRIFAQPLHNDSRIDPLTPTLSAKVGFTRLWPTVDAEIGQARFRCKSGERERGQCASIRGDVDQGAVAVGQLMLAERAGATEELEQGLAFGAGADRLGREPR